MQKYRIFILCLSLLLQACNTPSEEAGNAVIQGLPTPNKPIALQFKAKEHVNIGDPMHLSLWTEQNGRLWLLIVEPDNSISLIYPNKNAMDNTVIAKQWISIPAKEADWRIVAAAPGGISQLIAILTPPDIDLEADLLALNNASQLSDIHETLNALETWGIQTKTITVE